MAAMAVAQNATATIDAGEGRGGDGEASETAEELRPAGPLATTPALVAPTPHDVAPPARTSERMDTAVVEPLAQLALAASKRPAESTPKSSASRRRPPTAGRMRRQRFGRLGPRLGPASPSATRRLKASDLNHRRS